MSKTSFQKQGREAILREEMKPKQKFKGNWKVSGNEINNPAPELKKKKKRT